MANQQGRNVEVRMKFVADARQAQGEMAATRREVEKLGKEAQATQREMNKVGGGGGGIGAGAGAGAGSAGAGSNVFFQVLAKATFALAVFGKALDGAAKVAMSYSQETGAGRTSAITYSVADAVTLGGTSYLDKKLTDVWLAKSKSDVINAIANESYQSNVIVAKGNEDRRLRALKEEYQVADGTVRGAGEAAQRSFEARTAGRTSKLDPQLVEARIDAGAAFRRSNIADEAYIRSRGNVSAREGELAKLIKQRDTMPLGGNEFSAEANAVAWRLKNLEVSQKMKEVEEAILQRKQKGVEFEQLYLEARKKSVEASRIELGLLKEKESQAKGAAAEFGMMGGSDKLALKYALQQAQAGGIDSLPEESRQLLARSGLTSKFASERSEQSVQNDPVYQSIVQALGGKTSSRLGKEVVELENKINLDIKGIDEDFAAQVAKKLKEAFDDMDKNIRAITAQELKNLLNQRKQIE